MLKVFEFFASRHLLANLLTGMILLTGVGTLFTISRDLFPRVELDQVVIRTAFPGASADDVELNVTNKIEAELVGVAGVDRVFSTSAEDVSVITVLLDSNLSRPDIDATIQEIREATGRARNLPRDLPAAPLVSRLRASEIPVIEVGFEASELSYAALRERVRVIEKKMRDIPGVANIQKFGFRARGVTVKVSPEALKQYDIPLTEIARTVQARNVAACVAYAIIAMPIEIFPAEGAEHFTVYVETLVGTSLNGTAAVVGRLERLIEALPDEEIDSYFSLIGTQGGFLTQDHLGVIYVNLTPYSGRKRNATEIIDALRPVAEKIEGLERVLLDVKDSGPSPEKSVSLRILGVDNAARERLARDVAEFLKTLPGVTDVDPGLKTGKRQVELRLDYPALARLGMSVAEIARTVRIAYDGEAVTRVQYGEDEIEFRLTMPASAKTDLRTLGELSVPNALGNLVPLKHVAEFRDSPDPAAYIQHFNGERSINVQASTDKDVLKPEDVPALVLKRFDLTQYPGTRIRVEGVAKRQDENIGYAARTFVLAIAGIYCLLVLLFNSFRQPFYVMTAVPFGLSGVIVTFALHGFPLSFMAMLGIVSLSGVVVNDSLVLVDHINFLRAQVPGEALRTVVARAAGDRLRAILMTTVTTVGGLLPLAYGVGGADPANAPMALALGWGLLFATVLVLVLVPALYLSGEEWSAGRKNTGGLINLLQKPVVLFWTRFVRRR